MEIRKHKQTQTEWEQEMCEKILSLIQNELYLDFRYLDMALSALAYQPKDQIRTLATDGNYLYYSVEQLFRLYPKNPLFMDRAYLHSVLHCVFRHLWLRGKREPFLWNLACDICVEYTIDHLHKPTTERILTRIRINYYEHLKEEKIPVTAAAIYEDLLTIEDPETQLRIQEEFYTDDHRFWPKDSNSSQSPSKQTSDKWDKIGRRSQQELERRGDETNDGITSLKTQITRGKSRRSYQEFLRKFTVLREELHCDEDSFDLNYYTYGLRVYGNMPLIEPLESREVMKILDFVVVIDTSYSTNGKLVRRFLEETFQIITERNSFFQKSQIRVIQCDNKVQKDMVVKNQDDIEKLFREFEMVGGGGTDFRPAFRYIDELKNAGEFQHLKGVLYFTDGKGIYPAKRPDYETAFLFIGENEGNDVPPWAMTMTLMEDWISY
ncbi:MAG: VWA-like domain-containing protein [Eubacteriales bacterium]|nr:VWA-like domain-containing protein [Eubacteriales bacterium]